MSDDLLRIIPTDPEWVPSEAAGVAARLTLEAMVDADTVELQLTDRVQFVDSGENFESVSCPACEADLAIDWWAAELDRSFDPGALGFGDLSTTTPCCGRATTLNDLVYDWPAGFARFVLTATNAGIGGRLNADQAAAVAASLGHDVKQILAHY